MQASHRPSRASVSPPVHRHTPFLLVKVTRERRRGGLLSRTGLCPGRTAALCFGRGGRFMGCPPVTAQRRPHFPWAPLTERQHISTELLPTRTTRQRSPGTEVAGGKSGLVDDNSFSVPHWGTCPVSTAVTGQGREGGRLFVVGLRGGGAGRVRASVLSPTFLTLQTRKYKQKPRGVGCKILKEQGKS